MCAVIGALTDVGRGGEVEGKFKGSDWVAVIWERFEGSIDVDVLNCCFS